MSRFFATGDTDSESSSEDSDNEVKQVKPQSTRKVFAFSDDEEEEKRVVRSQKDKRYDELKGVIKQMKNSQKIKDIAKIQTIFENLQRVYTKSKGVLEQDGNSPKFFIKAITELEDFVQQLWDDKEAKQKLSKLNAKALATLKQKVRKYNKDFEDLVTDCRDNPSTYEDVDDDEAEDDVESDADDDDDDDDVQDVIPEKIPPPQKDDGESSDDSLWDNMSESDTSSDTDSDRVPGEYPYTAEYFLKKDPSEKSEKKKREKKVRVIKEERDEVDGEESEDEGGQWKVVHRQKLARELTDTEKMKALFGNEKVDLDARVVCKKRDELVANRGKRGTEKMDQIVIFKYLMDLAAGANLGMGVLLRLHIDIIDAALDMPALALGGLKEDVWKICLDHLEKLISMLISNSSITFNESVKDNEQSYLDASKPPIINGSLLGYMERMDDEYTKILQGTDAHSPEYLTKLREEQRIVNIIERAQHYVERSKKDTDICRVYIRRIEHMYYKVDRNSYGSDKTPPTDNESPVEDYKTLMSRFTKFIYGYPGMDLGPIKTRAVLCHIYHHAIHDRWYEARDLMLMTHLQEGIIHADVPTQILYNRTLVQLGMCAFRHGMIKDAHDTLMDIHSPPRPKDAKELAKELLAQGLNPRTERTQEQEKQERKRQVPFHMHINLELMECVYLTSAMLLEIPYMAATEFEGRKRMISKGFYHQLKNREKQPLVGPPETMREHVVAAANAMKKGDWRMCCKYIMDIKIWNLFINVDQVKEMLKRKVQEESLRTYIFTYGSVYDSLSLNRLSEMFELPLTTVHCVVSKMIIKEELLASLDEPTQSIVMHHAKPTKLQSLALNLADKIGTLADNNEELLKVKQGPAGSGWLTSTQVLNTSNKPAWAGTRRKAK